MGNGRLSLPAGVRDMLPEEAARVRQLENVLVHLFASWGYQEVIPPTFEYADTYTRKGSSQSPGYLFRFIDQEGEVVALRPEFTTPIARLVSTRLNRASLPLRLFYLGNVFRYQSNVVGGQREFRQAGLELIGATGARADAEVVLLAAEALLAAGLRDFHVLLGHVQITEALLAASFAPAGIPPAREALMGKDYAGLNRMAREYGLQPETWQVRDLHGGREVLDRLRTVLPEQGNGPARELAEVWEALSTCGLENLLSLDLTLVRDLDYYTGMVFEIYAPGLGFPVGGGGRYDHLLEQFGLEAPATGFAIGIERLLAVMPSSPQPPAPPDYLVGGKTTGDVLAQARELRRQGYQVELLAAGISREQAREAARVKGAKELCYLD
ncbi:MAG: ATP phosphoribosyltransferase regulatory subunit [Clostridia bacterium]|nr:MAG: ATP phosphoribosyltransferase regulatory subunit [Clostridia bacterium]